jgi:hypothetical protein
MSSPKAKRGEFEFSQAYLLAKLLLTRIMLTEQKLYRAHADSDLRLP